MYCYQIDVARKNELQNILNRYAAAGWKLHTAHLTPMNQWELIFEADADASIIPMDVPSVVTATPKKRGRKPKVSEV